MESGSGDSLRCRSESWVKTYTTTELAKLNNTYLKTDGANSMNANLDFNSNELDNVT